MDGQRSTLAQRSIVYLPGCVRFTHPGFPPAHPVAIDAVTHDRILATDAQTLARVASLLPAVCAEGNTTDHVRALRCGLALRPDVLFLVTDAKK